MQHGKTPGIGFVTSASVDHGLTLWHPLGVHVGTFGQQQPWDFDDIATWKSSSADPAPEATQEDAKTSAVQQQSRVYETAVGALLASETSELSDDGSAYSSGDEVLPECFKEPIIAD